MNQRGIGILVGGLLIVGLGASPAVAAPTSMVDLGQASTYAVLSGASVDNTVSAPGAPHTTLRGDLGVKANTQPTGFPPGVVTGAVNVGNAAAGQAHADLVAAYTEVAARTGGAPLAGALAGATITPGLHTVAGAVSNTGTVTLDGGGDPDAVFVFQVSGAMAMAAASHVVLSNGARASRVFWQVNGAGAIGANADFAGTLMALDAVAVGNGSLVNGRALARNGALTLDADEVYSAPPVVTIAGGAAAVTTDTTPTISGTTDIEPPAVVTVTIHGQTLTATPSGGAWSVTSAILANATYPVVASVVDGAGNPGSAGQQLTVDTVLPVVTIDGGPSVTTSDPTPTLTGTSDAAPGTVVRVSIGAQVWTALVQADGTWNVTPSALTEGTRAVTASVTDPAGNVGSAGQTLTIAPAGPTPPVAPPAASLAAPITGRLTLTNAAVATTVARARRQKVKGSTLSIATKVTAPDGGAVVATATGTVKITGARKAIRLTRVVARVAAGRSATLRLRPSGARKTATAACRRISKAAREGKGVTATITVRVSDAFGHNLDVKGFVKLTA